MTLDYFAHGEGLSLEGKDWEGEGIGYDLVFFNIIFHLLPKERK